MADILSSHLIPEPDHLLPEPEKELEQEFLDGLKGLRQRSAYQLARLRGISNLILDKPEKFEPVLYPVALSLSQLLNNAEVLEDAPEPNVISISPEYQIYRLWESLNETNRNWKLEEEYDPKLATEPIAATIRGAIFLIETKAMKKVLSEYQRQEGKKLTLDGEISREQLKEMLVYLGVFAIALLALLIWTESGPFANMAETMFNQEVENFPLEESRNLYLAQKEHLLTAQSMEEFRQSLAQKIRFSEVTTATAEDLEKWSGEIQGVLREMGLEDGAAEPYEYRITDLPEGQAGTVEKNHPNTLLLDDEVMMDAKWTLYVMAHEAVHIEAEHTMVRFPVFEQFGDFTLALWSVQYRESQAELLTLELLARIAESGSDDEMKALAREAIYQKLVRATDVSHRFISMMADGTENDVKKKSLHNSYYYSYVPMWKIQEMVHGGFYEVPVVEHGPLSIVGNRLQEVPMSGFGRFLWNEGLIQENSGENSPNLSK